MPFAALETSLGGEHSWTRHRPCYEVSFLLPSCETAACYFNACAYRHHCMCFLQHTSTCDLQAKCVMLPADHAVLHALVVPQAAS